MKINNRFVLIIFCIVAVLSWLKKCPSISQSPLPPKPTEQRNDSPTTQAPTLPSSPLPTNSSSGQTTTNSGQQPGRPDQSTELPNAINQRLADNELAYTKHARCRMECRHISEQEIAAVMKHGKVNARKSEPDASPCPKYALEAQTNDGQTVRIIFADCGNETRVITAIDLKDEHHCDCE